MPPLGLIKKVEKVLREDRDCGDTHTKGTSCDVKAINGKRNAIRRTKDG